VHHIVVHTFFVDKKEVNVIRTDGIHPYGKGILWDPPLKPIEPVSETIPLLFYEHFKGSVNAQSSDMCHFRGR